MASQAEGFWQATQQLELEVLARALDTNYPTQNILEDLHQLRLACENLLFADFDFGTSKNIGDRLWEAHGKVKSRFRKAHQKLRVGNNVVLRKSLRLFLDFIKDSQRFYRGYIQRLNSHFGGIPEIETVAARFKFDNLSKPKAVVSSPQTQHAILLSCHYALICLGDLSRWRETENVSKERNWGPAIGYYDLAGAIYPASGASHNQLAVISLVEGNHLHATYHLYRALAVNEPYPLAGENLGVEFKKISVAWSKGELIPRSRNAQENAANSLLAWFVRLHARCFKGDEFSERDELENEVLSRLATEVKERALNAVLHKFVLINTAAQYYAGVRLQQEPENQANFSSFFYYVRLNVKTFLTLLQVLQPELERYLGSEASLEKDDPPFERISAVTRRILPALRHYSSWLLCHSEALLSQHGDNALHVQIKGLWRAYANSLTLLAATFPVSDLPVVHYLLEEDEDTLGFKPFCDAEYREASQRRYYVEKRVKPRFHDPGVERNHPNTEMMSRIRDFLADGLELVVGQHIPIELADGGTFIYQEPGIPSELLARPLTSSTNPSLAGDLGPKPQTNGAASQTPAIDRAGNIARSSKLSASASEFVHTPRTSATHSPSPMASSTHPRQSTGPPLLFGQGPVYPPLAPQSSNPTDAIESTSISDEMTKMVSNLVDDDDANDFSTTNSPSLRGSTDFASVGKRTPTLSPGGQFGEPPDQVALKGGRALPSVLGTAFTPVVRQQQQQQQRSVSSPMLGSAGKNSSPSRFGDPSTSFFASSTDSAKTQRRGMFGAVEHTKMYSGGDDFEGCTSLGDQGGWKG